MASSKHGDSMFLTIRDSSAGGEALSRAIDRARGLPCWSGSVDIRALSGGLSNVNLIASCSAGQFVVRYRGTKSDLGLSLEREAGCLRAASTYGVAPRVLYSDQDTIVMEMLDGAALLPEDLRNLETLREIAAALRTFHAAGAVLDIPEASFWPFHHCRWLLREVLQAKSSAQEGAPELVHQLIHRVDTLERFLGSFRIVLGHGDMVPQNIMRSKTGIKFVDLEYAGYAPDLFDLGGLGMNGELEDEAVEGLLSAYHECTCSKNLIARFHAMRLIAGIRELAWSMRSELKPVADFDYAGYSQMCLERLHRQSRLALLHGVPGA